MVDYGLAQVSGAGADRAGQTGQTEQIAADVRRVADRLRSLSEARLVAGAADRSHATAQLLADAAATLEQVPARRLPRLGDLAAGDQLAVVGHDLLAALAAAPAGQHGDVVPAGQHGDVVTAAVQALADLRRSL